MSRDLEEFKWTKDDDRLAEWRVKYVDTTRLEHVRCDINY